MVDVELDTDELPAELPGGKSRCCRSGERVENLPPGSAAGGPGALISARGPRVFADIRRDAPYLKMIGHFTVFGRYIRYRF